jgi:hypothetical protein
VVSFVIQVCSAFYCFPGCFYRFSGCLHGFSGADVGCLGRYLIFSVVAWGFLGGHMDFLGVYAGFLGVIRISWLVLWISDHKNKSVCFNVRIFSSKAPHLACT